MGETLSHETVILMISPCKTRLIIGEAKNELRSSTKFELDRKTIIMVLLFCLCKRVNSYSLSATNRRTITHQFFHTKETNRTRFYRATRFSRKTQDTFPPDQNWCFLCDYENCRILKKLVFISNRTLVYLCRINPETKRSGNEIRNHGIVFGHLNHSYNNSRNDNKSLFILFFLHIQHFLQPNNEVVGLLLLLLSLDHESLEHLLAETFCPFVVEATHNCCSFSE